MNKKLSLVFGIMFLMVGFVSATTGCSGSDTQTCSIQNGVGSQERVCNNFDAYCEAGHWHDGYWHWGRNYGKYENHWHEASCDSGHWHKGYSAWSSWNECSVVSCNENYEPEGNECLIKVPVCDSENLNLCNEENCNGVGYWYDGVCNAEQEVEVPEEPENQVTNTEVEKPIIESHGDGSCVVDWVCENGVAVKEKEFDPLPNSAWTREEKIAHGYKFLDSKYCVAIPSKKPDCSVNEITVVPLEQEPVKEQVKEVERTGWQKFWDWVFGRK
jgi:hypothetical protein